MKGGIEDPMDKPLRVLVVEDNVDDGDLLVRQLKKNNFEGFVKVIADGRHAWELLLAEDSRQNLVAIFLDLDLPSLSGLKLLGRIKSRPEFSNLPVFVMTSSNDPEDLAECTRLGIDGFISKPVSFMTFSKAVADLFHSSPAKNYARVE